MVGSATVATTSSDAETMMRNTGDSEGSENDEDFVPTEEMDVDEHGSGAAQPPEDSMYLLSAAKRKAVDEVFESLFGYPFGTDFQPKRRRQSRDQVSKQERILVEIFGSSATAQLLATSDSVRKLARKYVPLPLLEERTVTEVKRFAGRDVVVQKTVQVDEQRCTSKKNQVAAASETKAPRGGLDDVLAEMAGPSKISTVAKTSADWDAFKTDAGMDEELEKQAQGSKAYLVKKDFLQRVDERRFEKEKARRDQQRASKK